MTEIEHKAIAKRDLETHQKTVHSYSPRPRRTGGRSWSLKAARKAIVDSDPKFDRVDRAIREAYAEVEATLRARIDAERGLAACSAAHDRAGQCWFALVQLRIDASDTALQELRSAWPVEGA